MLIQTHITHLYEMLYMKFKIMMKINKTFKSGMFKKKACVQCNRHNCFVRFIKEVKRKKEKTAINF